MAEVQNIIHYGKFDYRQQGRIKRRYEDTPNGNKPREKRDHHGTPSSRWHPADRTYYKGIEAKLRHQQNVLQQEMTGRLPSSFRAKTKIRPSPAFLRLQKRAFEDTRFAERPQYYQPHQIETAPWRQILRISESLPPREQVKKAGELFIDSLPIRQSRYPKAITPTAFADIVVSETSQLAAANLRENPAETLFQASMTLTSTQSRWLLAYEDRIFRTPDEQNQAVLAFDYETKRGTITLKNRDHESMVAMGEVSLDAQFSRHNTEIVVTGTKDNLIKLFSTLAGSNLAKTPLSRK